MRVFRLLAALMVVASTLGVRAQGKAFLIEIDPRSQNFIGDMSASGAVAVGTFNGGGGFYWMPTSGAVPIGGLSAEAVSGDGRTIVGVALDANLRTNAAIWQRGTEWRLLGGVPNSAPCDRSLSGAYGVSRDGTTVVGQAFLGCGAHAFRSTESSGMVDLGSTVAGRSSTAVAVSADGRVVVGEQDDGTGFTVGVRWVDGRQERVVGPVGPVGNAYGVNGDGTVVVGRQCRGPIPDQTAWMWSQRDGVRCLPTPTIRPSPGPPVLVYANAVSDDGRVVGGSQTVGTVDGNAILWIDGKESYLKDYLRAHGVPNAFETWVNTGKITGISPDGRVLVGYGAALTGFRGYMVILDELEPLP
jgi:uncharacterized membrane protein